MNRPAAVTLDARSLSPANKTDQILEAFDKLAIGTSVEINEETDPRALRNEMTQLRPGRFSWDARNLGSNRWTIRLDRIDEHAEGEALLQHVPQFTSAKATTIKELASQMSERSYKSGDTIFDEGEMWPYLGIVKSGKIIYTLLSPDGKTHTIGERLTHDTLNESGTFDSGGATTRAEALTDAVVITLPSEAVMHAARNDAELALGFLIAFFAGATPLDRYDRGSCVRARTAARREVLTGLRTRVGRHDARIARRRESLASANRRRRRYGARHGGPRAAALEERERGRTRSRAREGDRPRAPRSLCTKRSGAAGLIKT